TSPAAFTVEYSLGHNPLMHDLVAENFPIAKGRITIPDRPGLGVTIDDDFVRAYAVDSGPRGNVQMKLGIFMMLLHNPARNLTEVLAED
ncbi:MAG: enolase C-terminal domain-like protein, partial [Alphaproteobacteria bacterium]